MFDLLFVEANCLDCSTGLVRRCDVGVTDGQIALVREHRSDVPPARYTVSCAGYWLFPGFLDVHTHLFAHGSTFGLDADRLLTAGITYAVDMGSSGWVNYPAFRMCDLAGKRIGHSAFLNLSPVGQPEQPQIIRTVQKTPGRQY